MEDSRKTALKRAVALLLAAAALVQMASVAFIKPKK